MAEGACQQHDTTIFGIVDAVVPEGQVQLELVAGGLEVDEVSKLGLADSEGLLACLGLEEAGFGLAHESKHAVCVVAALGLLLGLVDLGVQLFVLSGLGGRFAQHI